MDMDFGQHIQDGKLMIPCTPDGEPDLSRMARIAIEADQLVVFHPDWGMKQARVYKPRSEEEVLKLRLTYEQQREEAQIEDGEPIVHAVIGTDMEILHRMIDMILSGQMARIGQQEQEDYYMGLLMGAAEKPKQWQRFARLAYSQVGVPAAAFQDDLDDMLDAAESGGREAAAQAIRNSEGLAIIRRNGGQQ